MHLHTLIYFFTFATHNINFTFNTHDIRMDNEGDDRLAQVLAVRTTLTARRDQIKELKMLMKIDPTGPHAEMLKKIITR